MPKRKGGKGAGRAKDHVYEHAWAYQQQLLAQMDLDEYHILRAAGARTRRRLVNERQLRDLAGEADLRVGAPRAAGNPRQSKGFRPSCRPDSQWLSNCRSDDGGRYGGPVQAGAVRRAQAVASRPGDAVGRVGALQGGRPRPRAPRARGERWKKRRGHRHRLPRTNPKQQGRRSRRCFRLRTGTVVHPFLAVSFYDTARYAALSQLQLLRTFDLLI